jgi:FkbM family methyltransferase
LLKNLIKSWIFAAYRARGHYSARIHGISFRVNPSHLGFWRSVSRGRWENETFAILDRFLKTDLDFIDIGAWIGPLTLYGASQSRRVLAVEPDFHAYRCLLENLELNRVRNVVTFQAALGARTEIRRMSIMQGQPGNSLTRLTDLGPGGDTFEVPGFSWTDWVALANPGKVSLIKIDIEGGEFELLPAMMDYLAKGRPPLLISLHLPFLPPESHESCLAGFREVLDLYRNCLDERMQTIQPEALFERMRREVTNILLVGAI